MASLDKTLETFRSYVATVERTNKELKSSPTQGTAEAVCLKCRQTVEYYAIHRQYLEGESASCVRELIEQLELAYRLLSVDFKDSFEGNETVRKYIQNIKLRIDVVNALIGNDTQQFLDIVNQELALFLPSAA